MLYGIIGLIYLILFLIAAIEILTGGKSVGNKVLWMLIIILLNYIGLILYFFIGRGK